MSASTVTRRKSFAENENVVRHGYTILREATEGSTCITRLVDALERSHLTTLEQLETTAELYATVDLNLRSILERVGA